MSLSIHGNVFLAENKGSVVSPRIATFQPKNMQDETEGTESLV